MSIPMMKHRYDMPTISFSTMVPIHAHLEILSKRTWYTDPLSLSSTITLHKDKQLLIQLLLANLPHSAVRVVAFS